MTSSTGTRLRSFLLLVVGIVTLSACQLEMAVDVVVNPDGTGTISVVTTADPEIVAAVPTLADELAFDDIVAAGWAVEGPIPTPGGGLIITLTHDFTSAAEATNLLRSLGPPFNEVELGRGTNGDVTTNQLGGRMGLPDGFESFADDELVTAIGSMPFEEQIAASGASPESSISATLRAQLPGELVEAETNAVVLDDGTLKWTAPTDGSVLEWSARSEQTPSEGSVWARPVSIAALVAFFAWVGFMGIFILYVAFARLKRAREHKYRPRPKQAQRPPVDVG